MSRPTNVAGHDNTWSFSCEGTLLVPTVDDRVSQWRERLVSGNRLTIILKVVGQRWSSDARFLLWGENCLQEKVFEVNLRYLRAYFVRTRTWHEITSSDRRRFALSFQDSNQFARFYEELESTLSFLKKLTTMGTAGDTGGIVVLRVDKLPPAKPPRAGDLSPSSVGDQTPPLVAPRVSDCGQYPTLISPVGRGGSIETREDVTDSVSQDEQTTKWYVNIGDGITTAQPESKLSDNNYYTGIYETIDDPMSSLPNPNEGSTQEHFDRYDNISVVDSRPCAIKPNKPNASNSLLNDGNSRVVQSRQPLPRKPIEAHVYDDRDRYDNNTTLDSTHSPPVATKPKPKIPPRSNDPTGNKPISGVTNDANRRPNMTSETGTAKPPPQPLPRPKKPKEDRSPGEDAWTCNQCTLINPMTTNCCAACDTDRHGSCIPPVTVSRVPPVTVSRDNPNGALQRLPSTYIVPSACFEALMTADDNWKCSVCSATNRRDSDACHSCSAWICNHCTLHNHPDLWVCSICSHSRLLS